MIVIAGTIPVKAERWSDAKALAAKMVEETLKELAASVINSTLRQPLKILSSSSKNGNRKRHLPHTFRPSICKIS